MESTEATDSIEPSSAPLKIDEIAKYVINGLLPDKSRERYNLTYAKFLKWKKTRNINNVSEHAMLVYFQELAQDMQPSTLWSVFSMLKSTLSLKHNIDIGKYNLLTAYLKRRSEGFRSKKSKILSSQDVERFLKEAPDVEYLATKAALILGICGACRGCELTNMTTDDVKEHDGIFLVQIEITKNKKPRSFAIEGDFYDIVKKYISLRPQKADTNRFFLNYQHGKCTRQAIGKNKFASMPKQIAQFLKLNEAALYTSHSFRRTSATLLADSGANITTIKRHGGWRSDSVAEGYIEDSVGYKRKIGQMISSSIQLKSPKSDENSVELEQTAKKQRVETSMSSIDNDSVSGLMFEEALINTDKKKPFSIVLNNCTNCNITLK